MSELIVHELKILPEYFPAVDDGSKTFEIRKKDRDYRVGDFLLLKEFDGEKYTGYEMVRQVTYMTDYEQKEGYVVLAITNVPRSLATYLSLTDKEKEVFKCVVTHMHLYGLSNRDAANTMWDIVRTLLGNDDLLESDQQWFMEYWDED